ncbi:unnamed protein product [Linum trigynum]|uniref:Uncharacterized protein n=1 Tax=Linum trigynum TaxID=586398 RepID=A0AAV2DZD2_9ROSI
MFGGVVDSSGPDGSSYPRPAAWEDRASRPPPPDSSCRIRAWSPLPAQYLDILDLPLLAAYSTGGTHTPGYCRYPCPARSSCCRQRLTRPDLVRFG